MNASLSKKDEQILKAYGVLTAISAVESHDPVACKTPILINEILAYVQGSNNAASQRVQIALANDLMVRRQYMQLLKLNQLEHIAKPRAAHTEAVFAVRVGEHGVILKMKQSKGDAQQFYLIIELPETIKVDKDKSLVLHANTETQTQRTVFPAIHDGRSRIIINKEDPLFALLQDHDVEIDIQ
jgi:hypothetical protein